MQLFINNWASALALPAASSATQLSVPEADADLLVGLGTGDHYLLTLAIKNASGIETDWEIVRVTAATAGVLDVERAQEGTAALDLEAGVSISARLTKGGVRAIQVPAGVPHRFVDSSDDITPADAGSMIISTSATPVTLTITAEAAAAWSVSGLLPMVHIFQEGPGAVTVAGEGFSVNLHASDTNVLDGSGAAATALWRSADTWSLFGRLVAA